MHPARFKLALEQLDGADWGLFESLASAFLAAEFGTLRTVASKSGDGGRDAFLYQPEGQPTVTFQYSVSKDWSTKVKGTAARLATTFPEVRDLVYVTNQLIGPKADALRRSLRQDFELYLDVYDLSWFVDRVNTLPQRTHAAEELSRLKVDPLLESKDVIQTMAPALTSEEQKCAVVYLNLQLEDEEKEKGLTRVCFEALVRAALRGTDSNNRISRRTIHDRVEAMIPWTTSVSAHIDRALSKLGANKDVVKHWRGEDEFCLSHAEVTRLGDQMAALEQHRRDFDEELSGSLSRSLLGRSLSLDEGATSEAMGLLRTAIDQTLCDRGESFATALSVDEVSAFESERIAEALERQVERSTTRLDFDIRRSVCDAARRVLVEPGPASRKYLQSWSHSYTMLAMLKQTGDVQSTVVKLFSSGRIWIDANILLPILAEDLLEPERRQYSNLLNVARECGLELFVTEGIVEELIFHMKRSLTYVNLKAQGKVWRSEVPLLYAAYGVSERPLDGFSSWLSNFRGEARPDTDLAEYLEHRIGAQVRNLETESEAASVELRGAVKEVWFNSKARQKRSNLYQMPTVERLVNHDIECYLGVVQLRRQETTSDLGFTSWWLTLDRTAYRVRRELENTLGGVLPASPVMSPDFLLNYLEIGPLRRSLNSEQAVILPIGMDIDQMEGISPDLLERAEEIRRKSAGLEPYRVRRDIRDAMDLARSNRGPLAVGGEAKIEEEVLAAIAEEGR